MINYDDLDQTLLSFYSLDSLNLNSVNDLNLLLDHDLFDIDELNDKSTDEQFNILNQIINDNLNMTNTYDNNDDDYYDPLSKRPKNIVKELLDRNIISSIHDPNLSKFLINSKQFDSKQYLSIIHENSSIDDLNVSLSFLERNIENQTSELKSVINDNFINFINSKQAIDNVLVNFKNSKSHTQQERDKSKVFNPSRHKTNVKNDSLSSELEESLSNLQIASDLMMRPIEEHSLKELKILKLIDFIKDNKFFFDLPNNLLKYISSNNHNQFIDDYHRFLKEKDELMESKSRRYQRALDSLDPIKDANRLKDLEIEHIVCTNALSRIFNEVDNIINEYRKKIYQELITMDHEVGLGDENNNDKNTSEKFISFVDTVYQLDNEGSTKNPIHEFLVVQLNTLSKDLDYQNNKFDAKFTMMQRKLLDYIGSLVDHRENGSFMRYINEKYISIEEILKTSFTTTSAPSKEQREKLVIESFESSDNLDLSIINETWLILINYMNYLNDVFLKNIDKFVNNYLHYTRVENGFNIDPDGKIRDLFLSLMKDSTSRLVKIFNNNELVDQMTSLPENYTHFLPYYTNSLSTVFYLTNISKKIDLWLTRIGENIVIIGNTSKNVDTNKFVHKLRDYSNLIDQKILEACCSTWVNDCSQFYDLENWEKINDNYEVYQTKDSKSIYTKTMRVLESYETYILTKLSQLVFDKKVDATTTEKVRIVASHPNKRILVSIEIQFMRSMNVLIDSLMKKYNLEKEKNTIISKNTSESVDVNNNLEHEIFKILTMNNFDLLSNFIYPRIIKKYDLLFKKDLLNQTLKLYSDIDKASLTIFDDVLMKEKEWIQTKVFKHFNKINGKYVSSNKFKLKIDGFIYEILIHFIKLIHIVKPLTGVEIFQNMINELQTFFLNSFLNNLRDLKQNEGFKEYGNLKLDVYFFVEVFDPSEIFRLNDYCMNLITILNKEIEEIEGNPIYSQRDFESVLNEGLKNSENEFEFNK